MTVIGIRSNIKVTKYINLTLYKLQSLASVCKPEEINHQSGIIQHLGPTLLSDSGSTQFQRLRRTTIAYSYKDLC